MEKVSCEYKILNVPQEADSSDKPWITSWRVVNVIMSVFFLLSAYVQLNDPDPYIWVPTYLVSAMLSISIAIDPDVKDNTLWKRVSGVHTVLCVIGSLILLFLIVDILSTNVSNPLEHEVGRELGGVLLILAWLTICRFSAISNGDPSTVLRVIVLAGLLSILPLIFWSLCFIDGLHTRLGHCKGMFPGMLG